MKQLSLLIKPSSSNCNLRCKYCFYEDETKNRSTPCYGMMSPETLELVVQKALHDAEEFCNFGFQGGEPMLAGLDFYEHFAQLVEKYKKPSTMVLFSLQTNGTLITEEWARLFQKYHVLVGISLDGTKSIHDWNRIDASGKGTFQQITKNIRLLEKYGVTFNIVSVLTGQMAKHIRQTYDFLKKQGFFYHQYIPCLDPIGKEPGKEPYSLTPALYCQALCNLFDLYFEDWQKGNPVSVRYFDNWVQVLQGKTPEACSMYGRCSIQNVVEANGDIFPCDFYVLDEYRLGNIREVSFQELADRRTEFLFFQTEACRDDRCKNCRWYALCRGGCRRDCFSTPDGKWRNYYCEAYQEFFAYAYPRLAYMADVLSRPARR